jgi:hypothetical protein
MNLPSKIRQPADDCAGNRMRLSVSHLCYLIVKKRKTSRKTRRIMETMEISFARIYSSDTMFL